MTSSEQRSIDVPGGTYWRAWLDFVTTELVERGLVGRGDLDLFVITDDVDEACREVIGFYRNYHSIRWVGPTRNQCGRAAAICADCHDRGRNT